MDYIAPSIFVIGTAEQLTKEGGTLFQDSPVGTPIGSVTASDSF